MVTLLSPARIEALSLGPHLKRLRGKSKPSREDLERLCRTIGDQRISKRLDPLWGLIEDPEVLEGPADVAAALKLKPADRALFRLLMGEDVMLVTQPSLRVAAKVHLSKSNLVNRLTDGRIDLARLIGGGPEAPSRTAALRLIATKICLPDRPDCQRCPISEWCKSAVVTRSAGS